MGTSRERMECVKLASAFWLFAQTLSQKPSDHSSGKPEHSKCFATSSASLVFLALRYF
jgi:hypothetical protein